MKWFINLAWLGILLIMLRFFWQERQRLLQTQSWLKTKGHVTHCEWVKMGRSYWPKIQYTFLVNDKEVIGEYLFLDTAHNSPNSKYSRRIAYNAVIAFKNNSEIEVYYNPNQPNQSALDITMPVKLSLIIVLVGIMVLVHLCFIAYHVFL